MNTIKFIFVFIVLIGFAQCKAVLDIEEIKSLNKETFDDLTLKPDYDVYKQRIDVVRQSKGDSANTDEEYHNLGFNLGNGLFYDLNENLSFRFDYLFDIQPNSDFKITVINDSARYRRNYQTVVRNDTLFTYFYRKKKEYYQYHVKKHDDSLCLFYKHRQYGTILSSDTLLAIKGKRFVFNKINKQTDSLFTQKFRFYEAKYELKNNTIKLDRRYLVSLSPDKKMINIQYQGRRRSYPLYTIVKGDNKLFVFNENYFGQKLQFHGNKLRLYHFKNYFTEYEVEK